MTDKNPYLRAAKVNQDLRKQAIETLEQRLAEEPLQPLERARDDQGRFIADDPATPQDEAWVEVQTG